MELKKCGLYVTGIALEGKEEAIAAGRLVYFHNHSRQGPPIVLLPDKNTHNRWTFADQGFLVDGAGAHAFMADLHARPKQGFYVATAKIEVPGGEIPPRLLLQLGYNRRGEVILFPAQAHGNGLQFPEKGFRFADTGILASLRAADFMVQRMPEASDRTLH
jgi:hypothetical protein